VVTLFLSAPALAQNLTMTADKLVYSVGEEITLTITGDSQGASADFIFGTVNYDVALVSVTSQSQTQHTSFSGALSWILLPLNVDNPNLGTADAFNQGFTISAPVDQLQVATITFTANASGVASFSWRDIFSESTEFLNFFGLAEAPGTSVTILPASSSSIVSVHASVTDPIRIASAPDGTLYAGRDNSGSGGTSADAVRIHQVDPTGSPVFEYGDVTIFDPDAVAVDVGGDIGSAGSVLVGGVVSGASGGRIWEVAADESVSLLFTSTNFENPTDMLFDSTGRLLFTNNFINPGLFESTGGVPTALVSTAVDLEYIALGDSNEIFVSTSNGSILRYNASGAFLGEILGLGGPAPIAFGEELTGSGTSGLYAVNSAGELVFFDLVGPPTVAGDGFEFVVDLEFGPDGSLFAAEFANDRILRLPEPSAGLPAGLALLILLARRRSGRHR
jgi:hypothetical protein